MVPKPSMTKTETLKSTSLFTREAANMKERIFIVPNLLAPQS